MKLLSLSIDQKGYLDTSMIRKQKDIPYAEESLRQCFDIYYPSIPQERYPIILFVHGGALTKGDKGRYQLLPALSAIQEGYAVVSMNYRLLPQATFVEAIEDVERAITYLMTHGEQYDLDADRIAVWGESVGASLVVQAITRRTSLAGIRLVIDWYGSVNLQSIEAQMTQNPTSFAQEIRQLHRKKFGSVSEQRYQQLIEEYQPLHRLHSALPAFVIQHGGMDRVVPVEQSLEFYEALCKVLPQSSVHLKLLEEAGHAVQDFSSEENLTYLYSLIHSYVKTAQSI